MARHAMHSAWIDLAGHAGAAGDEGALFPWWSFTKTVIAICALRLVETGRLTLDEPVPACGCTLRQLLRHEAGIPDYRGLAVYHQAVARGEDAWSRQELLDAIRPAERLFAPGEGWSYSNVGYMFAREFLEERSGRDLADLVAAFIGRPLGLESLRLASTRADFADLHWTAGRGYDPAWVCHGCLVGTAPDAARVLHAALAGDLLAPASRVAMQETLVLGGAVANRPWTTHGYALGLMSGEMGEAGRAVGHSGGGPFSVNAVYHFPERSPPVTVACFTDGTDEAPAEFEAARLARRS